ncbi:2-amino-4-hydroxy-6-hydroxymethyldihydropteridine diphosphokinase [Verrucomicrobia bacterium]|nr:2-amino-4-hydroxy-6-hydroxymethyldihydropteridine diphosphokinase [Verrucomicrobiota bacterium]
MKSGLRLNADAYLGLGANLGSPRETFDRALVLISEFAEITSVSRLYRSEPYGFSDQPPFVNATARIATNLPALELLDQLQSVERSLGKKVIRENGPRIIDLDLLLYDELELSSEELTLPHPGILQRDFVLLPLIDLNPGLRHPQWGAKTLKSALDGLQERFVGESPDDWNF